VTSIRPIVKSTVAGDGSITQKASTAKVTLEKDGTGYATVDVDITAAKVTRIVIVIKNVIDKSTS
jgi:hypothetical protein